MIRQRAGMGRCPHPGSLRQSADNYELSYFACVRISLMIRIKDAVKPFLRMNQTINAMTVRAPSVTIAGDREDVPMNSVTSSPAGGAENRLISGTRTHARAELTVIEVKIK